MSIEVPDNVPLQELQKEYVLSEKMKKVRFVQMDLLETFAAVCEKHNLRYFLNGGTLLGAVRHQGFIPWDDDVDVMMLREDYDRLCAIAPDVFQYPYFFQTALTEKGFFRTHAQLRNSDTTGCIIADAGKDINRGIFLDIFVIDGVSDSKVKCFFHKYTLQVMKELLWFAYDADYKELSLIMKGFYRIYQMLLKRISFDRQFRYFDQRILARYSRENTKLVGDLALGWKENVQWERDWFSDHLYLPFESLRFRVPSGYHQILSRQYGDTYMQIPKQHTGTQHGACYYDPDTPYRIYFSNNTQ